MIPSTRVEDEKVGPMADQVKETAKETGREQAKELRDSTQDKVGSTRT